MGLNLFSYCANNPVYFKDVSGQGIILACTLAFAAFGALFGGVYAADVSQQELGYVDTTRVVCGVVVGAGFGALIGWGIGSVASAIGIGATAKTLGTLTPGLCHSWQQAEQYIRSMFDGLVRAIQTPYGKRIIDCFSNGIAREVKYGYVCLNKFILQQLEKDVWLLTNGYVDSVEWHFLLATLLVRADHLSHYWRH